MNHTRHASFLNEWAIGIVLLLCVWVYHPVLQFDFLNWDDDQYILSNARFQPRLEHSIIAYFKGYDVGNYHPLTMLSYAIDASTPLQAKPFHRSNLILHLLNTLLVYVLLRRLLLSPLLAAVAAALFACHPMRVETVAWISDRKDLLMTLFYLSSLLAWIAYVSKQRPLFYVLCFLFFVAACLSKATAVTLPAVCLCYAVLVSKQSLRRTFIHLIPFWAVAIACSYLAVQAQLSIAAIRTDTAIPALWRPVFALYNLSIYAVQQLIPYGLKTYYPYPAVIDDLLVTMLLAGSAMLMAMLLYFKTAKHKHELFLCLFGVLAILPVLQLLPVGEAMRADRYSYLPAAAWSALPLLWLQRISSRKPRLQPWMRMAPVALLLALLLYQTQRLLPGWQNSETLWRRSISENPLWYAAYNNLGMHYLNVGRVNEAKSMFRKALVANPNIEGAYINLGFIFNTELNADSASYYLTTGCRKFPSNAIMLNNFAYTLYLQKQYHEALQQVNRSLAIYRDNAYAYRNRAYIYEALQQYALACEDCKHALALNYTAQWGDDVLLLQARVCARAHVP